MKNTQNSSTALHLNPTSPSANISVTAPPPAEHHITASTALEYKGIFWQVYSHWKYLPDLMLKLLQNEARGEVRGSGVARLAQAPPSLSAIRPHSHFIHSLQPLKINSTKGLKCSLSHLGTLACHKASVLLQFSQFEALRNVLFSYVTTQHVAYGRWQQRSILWVPQQYRKHNLPRDKIRVRNKANLHHGAMPGMVDFQTKSASKQ